MNSSHPISRIEPNYLPDQKKNNYLRESEINSNMKTQAIQFNDLVDHIYNMPLEDKLELKNLLEHNIADSRREEIANNVKKAKEEHKSGKLSFSSNITELKN